MEEESEKKPLSVTTTVIDLASGNVRIAPSQSTNQPTIYVCDKAVQTDFVVEDDGGEGEGKKKAVSPKSDAARALSALFHQKPEQEAASPVPREVEPPPQTTGGTGQSSDQPRPLLSFQSWNRPPSNQQYSIPAVDNASRSHQVSPHVSQQQPVPQQQQLQQQQQRRLLSQVEQQHIINPPPITHHHQQQHFQPPTPPTHHPQQQHFQPPPSQFQQQQPPPYIQQQQVVHHVQQQQQHFQPPTPPPPQYVQQQQQVPPSHLPPPSIQHHSQQQHSPYQQQPHQPSPYQQSHQQQPPQQYSQGPPPPQTPQHHHSQQHHHQQQYSSYQYQTPSPHQQPPQQQQQHHYAPPPPHHSYYHPPVSYNPSPQRHFQVTPTPPSKQSNKAYASIPGPRAPTPKQQDDASSSDIYSRKTKSLGLLCENFCKQNWTNGLIGIDKAATHLGVERRRIYDIVNILESLEIVTRMCKNQYKWKGFGRLPTILAQVQQEGLQEMQEDARMFGLLREDEIAPLPGEGEDADAPKKKSLGKLSRQFLMLFLVGHSVVTLADASDRIMGKPDIDHSIEDPDARKAAETKGSKTKIRRLYDIANVLASIGLVSKTDNCSGGGNTPESARIHKPAFQWAYHWSPQQILHSASRKHGAGSEIGGRDQKRSKHT